MPAMWPVGTEPSGRCVRMVQMVRHLHALPVRAIRAATSQTQGSAVTTASHWPPDRWPWPEPPDGVPLAGMQRWVIACFITACGGKSFRDFKRMIDAVHQDGKPGALQFMNHVTLATAQHTAYVAELTAGRFEGQRFSRAQRRVGGNRIYAIKHDAAVELQALMDVGRAWQDGRIPWVLASGLYDKLWTMRSEDPEEALPVADDVRALLLEFPQKFENGTFPEFLFYESTKVLSAVANIATELYKLPTGQRQRQLIKTMHDLSASLDLKKSEMRGELSGFREFCRTVRGYDKPEFIGDPNVQLMALGRLFIDRDDVELQQVTEVLEEVDAARKAMPWDEIAPNALFGYSYLNQMVDSEEGRWLIHFARAWARDGYPVVELPHRTAASLMFTHGAPGADITPPWRAFIVKVPDGILKIDDAELSRVLIWYSVETELPWQLTFHFRSAAGLVVSGVSVKTLDIEADEFLDRARGELFVDQQAYGRAASLAMRLIAGACMLISAKQGVDQKAWQPKGPRDRRRPAGMEPPEGTRFIVSKNVELDLREQVQEFVSGKTRAGAKLTCQFVVRGHRRWQVCGKGHLDRKLIWIAPFWKGPKDGRALMRGYEIKQEKDLRVDPATAPHGDAIMPLVAAEDIVASGKVES